MHGRILLTNSLNKIWGLTCQSDTNPSDATPETDLQVVLLVEWQMGIVSTSCGGLYFCRVSTLWASSTECLRSLSPRIKLTLTENIRLLTHFNNHNHHTAAWVPIRQGQGNNSIWHHKCAYFVSTLVHFTFRVNDEDIDIEEDKDGECIKEEPQITALLMLNLRDNSKWPWQLYYS